MSEVATMPVLELDLISAQVEAGLKRVQEVKEQTAELKEKSETVKIEGADDKVGFLATKDFLGVVRSLRTGLEKERQVCVKPFNDTVSYINDAYKTAMSELQAIESPHKAEKEEYEAAIEKRKADEAAAAEKLITDKINLLCQNGLMYDANNGYYKNDVGIAVTRANIITLSEEDFNKLLDRVKARKEELDAIQKAADEKAAEAELRRKALIGVGMRMGISELAIMDMETGDENIITLEEIADVPRETFEKIFDKAALIQANNVTYHEKIKAAQEETRLKAIELEKQAEKLKLDKVSVFKDKLEGIGFKYAPGSTVEAGLFSFWREMGSVSISVAELLNRESLLDETIYTCQKIKEQQTEFNNAQEEQEKINQAKKEEQHRLDTQRALNAEARKKKMSRTDLAKIDPLISELLSITERIKATNFELIGERVLTLVEGIEGNIDTLNKATKHLRNA